jgi:uncharacterized DUF497 family protein
MRIASFEWDHGNLTHIARHRVDADEVEEAFLGRHYLFRTKEGRYILLGRSGTGRFLLVVFLRQQDAVVRAITARDMTSAEKRLYRRKL